MSLLFYPQKSHRHSALRESALACVVYDHRPVLDCKDNKNIWTLQNFKEEISLSWNSDFVRPDGLPVRRPRTQSLNTSDWARAYDVAIVNKRRIERRKSTHSKMSLPWSRHIAQMPINKGLRAREGNPFSLPSPSRFHSSTTPVLFFSWTVNQFRNMKK